MLTTEILSKIRKPYLAAAFFSGCINLLMLTAPIFTLQLFERVIPNRSIETLTLLFFIAFTALCVLALLERVRDKILIRTAQWFEHEFSARVLAARLTQNNYSPRGDETLSQDLSLIRTALSGASITPLFDLPWAPFFILIVFLLHPYLGAVVIGACLILCLIIILNMRSGGSLLGMNADRRGNGQTWWNSTVLNADTLMAMGMHDSVLNRWRDEDQERLRNTQDMVERGSGFKTSARFVRMLTQIGIFAIGAWLAIQGQLTMGALIAASILMSRALLPFEQGVQAFSTLRYGLRAFRRLHALTQHCDKQARHSVLPKPDGALLVENLSYHYPGMQKLALRNISFELRPGEFLGIIGENGSGKSTLAALLAGVLQPSSGEIRLDDIALSELPLELRRLHLGFFLDNSCIMPASLSDNITRLDGSHEKEAIIAAQRAGVHKVLCKLPDAYRTQLDDEGRTSYSAREARAIALARVFHGEPKLMILDEAEKGYDRDNEFVLVDRLRFQQGLGTGAVLITQRPNMLRLCDRILVLKDGMVERIGDRDSIMKTLIAPPGKEG